MTIRVWIKILYECLHLWMLLGAEDESIYWYLNANLESLIPIYCYQIASDTLKGIFWSMIMAIFYVRPSLLMNV